MKLKVKSWEAANEMLAEIASVHQRMEKFEAAYGEKVNRINKERTEVKHGLDEGLKAMEKALEEFFWPLREELKPSKSKTLTFGILGWRTDDKWKYPRKLLEILKRLGYVKYVRQGKETADKELLHAQSTKEEQEEIGIKIKPVDTFYYELTQSGGINENK